jgi:glycosyltransferase involved in cell wall biosynthesis
MPSILTRILGRLAGVPVIITSERSLALHRGRFSRWLEPLSRKLSTFVVTNTWAGKESLLRASSVPERKISVIYNGLDGDEFCPAADSARARARSNFDIAADVFAIVLPGRIVWEKNHECLLRAAARADLGTPFSIMFFGQELDTTLKKRLELLAEELRISESVRFCGAVSEMAEVYALADVVVLPSLTEALPNVVIEAMASGRIVAATDISDNRRLMEDGVSGFLFPNNDHDALARVLELISRLPDASRAAIQGAARSRILNLCSKERMGASFIALVEAGAGRSSSGAAATGRSSKINARSRTDAVNELEDAEVP